MALVLNIKANNNRKLARKVTINDGILQFQILFDHDRKSVFQPK